MVGGKRKRRSEDNKEVERFIGGIGRRRKRGKEGKGINDKIRSSLTKIIS